MASTFQLVLALILEDGHGVQRRIDAHGARFDWLQFSCWLRNGNLTVRPRDSSRVWFPGWGIFRRRWDKIGLAIKSFGHWTAVSALLNQPSG